MNPSPTVGQIVRLASPQSKFERALRLVVIGAGAGIVRVQAVTAAGVFGPVRSMPAARLVEVSL